MLVLSYYSGIFLRWSFDNSRTRQAISEFAVLAAVQFFLYAVEGVTPDYYVGSSYFDNVEGDILSWVPTTLVNVLSHSGSYRVADKVCTDPVLVSMAFHCVSEIDSC